VINITMWQEERINNGANFIELVWEEIRDKIIEMAVQIYELSSEQAGALRKAFRKRYEVVAI